MSSWVLILVPSSAAHGWPAVIGGYATQEDAERAGREATMAHLTQDAFEDAGWGMSGTLEERIMWDKWKNRAWFKYTTIPGNAG